MICKFICLLILTRNLSSDYKCKVKSSLQVHKRSHNGKTFQCKICDSRFTTKNNLRIHIRIHHGEKPYPCNICNYKCRQIANLQGHMRIHSAEKLFQCHLCSYKYKIKPSLKKHIMSIHSKKQ